MENTLNHFGNKIYSQNGHSGYLIPWSKISPLCAKWSGNRDPDLNRVQEMLTHHQNGGYLPRLIHLAVLDGIIVCYDGNHRREVFNHFKDENFTCVVDVMFNATTSSIYKAFIDINKSIEVPEIYTEEDHNATVKLQIIALANEYVKRYPAMASTSKKPQAGHFNRDKFVDNIKDIYESFERKLSIAEIAKLLEKLNIEYSQGRMGRAHSKIVKLDKCKLHNLWLFIDKDIPFDHVRVLAHPSTP